MTAATISPAPSPAVKGARPNDRVVASGWYRPHGRRRFRKTLDTLDHGQSPFQHSLYDIKWWTEIVNILKNDTAPAAAAAAKVILPVPEGNNFPFALGWYRPHRTASRKAKRDTSMPRTRRLLSTTLKRLLTIETAVKSAVAVINATAASDTESTSGQSIRPVTAPKVASGWYCTKHGCI